MKKQIVFTMAFVALVLAASSARAKTNDSEANPKMGCPLMGNAADGNFTENRNHDFSPRAPAQREQGPKRVVKGRTNT